MSESDHPFDRAKGFRAKAGKVEEDEQFEAMLVQTMLVTFRLSRQRGELIAEHQRRTGERRLTLNDFCERWPTFPLLLGCSRLPGIKLHTDPSAFLPALFNNFQHASFLQPYIEFCEMAQARRNGRALGFVVRRRGFKHGWVLHDGGMDQYRIKGSMMTYFGGTKDEPADLYLMNFDALLIAIRDGGWSGQ